MHLLLVTCSALVCGALVMSILIALPTLMAWAMYAYYFECHPLRAGIISKPSQASSKVVLFMLKVAIASSLFFFKEVNKTTLTSTLFKV